LFGTENYLKSSLSSLLSRLLTSGRKTFENQPRLQFFLGHDYTVAKAILVMKKARISLALMLFFPVLSSSGQTDVLTHRNANTRTGQNTSETTLTLNLNSATFGKVFSLPTDGYVYAQPLYKSNVSFPGQGVHNVLYVATEHDSVYAFDADGQTTTALWHVSFIDPSAGITTVPSGDVSTTDIVPEIGITGTPVIDPSTGTMYVVAKTKENGSYVQRLHALDITTGAEKFGGPVVIQAAVAGLGDGSSGGTLPFDPLRENQRAALLLSSGVVYVAFASHGDNYPYHGWVLGYNAGTLQQVAVFNDTPNASNGGIWQSGEGPSADASGNLFVISGNGTFDADVGGKDFGDSFLKLSANAGGLTVVDFFTPFNQASLSANDLDLGTTGPVLLPDQTGTAHPHLALGAGKDGNAYLVDRDNMGHFRPSDNSQIVQTIAISTSGVYGTPGFWESNIYFLAPNDVLKAFQLSGGLLSTNPSSQASTAFGFPGASPAISANGSTNGIVWVLDNSAFATSGPAILYAYDATDVSHELYNSTQVASRDQAGPAVKFTVPTVTNGKVYVGTQNEITVYGLLSPLRAQAGLVQTNSGTPSALVTTYSVGFSSPVAASDLLLVAVGTNVPTATITSVTDTLGNTFTPATSLATNTNWGIGEQVWSASGKASGTDTITVNVSQPANLHVIIAEYSGVATASPVDAGVFAGSGATAGTAVDSGPLATSTAGDLLFGHVVTGHLNESFTAGTGYTLRQTTPTGASAIEDQWASTTGTYHGTFTLGAADYWICALVALKPPFTSLTLSPSSVTGGSSSTGTVTLSAAAPSGGAVVSLSSSNTSVASVPSSVTVAAGATSASFTVSTNPVSTSTSVTISGSYSGTTQSATLTVTPPTLTSLTLSPSSVTGGSSSTGTVTLSAPAPSGGAVVSLSSSNTGVAAVPASVTVPAGATSASFTVSTNPVATTTSVTISASYGGTTLTATLTVNPALVPPSITSQPASQTVTAGQTATFSVTASGTAPLSYQWSKNGTPISGANSSSYSTPPTTTSDNGAQFVVVVSNAAGSATSNPATLTVTPPTLTSLTLDPSSVVGGPLGSSTGTVTLSGPAPSGGAVVSLSSSKPSVASVPASVTVPARVTSATFTVNTSVFIVSTTVTISGSYNSTTRSASLTVLL